MGFRQDFVVATSLQAEPVVLDSIGTLENKIFAQAVSEAVEESAQTIPLSLISVATELSSAPTYQSSAQLPSAQSWYAVDPGNFDLAGLMPPGEDPVTLLMSQLLESLKRNN